MKLRTILMAATLVAVPGAAQAQPVTGPYVSLGAGTSIGYPFDYNYEWYPTYANGHAVAGKFHTRPAYAGQAAVGYGFGNGMRVELGFDFLRNTIREDKSNIYGALPATGGQNTYGPMIDVLYDINLGLPVTPYVGAGVGYQWVKFASHINDIHNFGGGTDGDTVEGTRGSFAYNLIVGAAYPLPFARGLSLTVEYRFMQLVESRNYVSSYPNDGNAYDGPVHIGQQSSNSFLLGLRYQLFAPPAPAPKPAAAPAPAPVAAPAPAPARTYLVFFDWDKANLTPRAKQIVSEAAHASITTAVTKLNVNGYTDTSGAAKYNMKLSLRRANNVAAELVADGVAKDEIVIKGFGETHLLVPTGPNVREPQNRRVEIILH